MDLIGDVVKGLRDKAGLCISYDEIPTWVDPVPVPLPSRHDNKTKVCSPLEGESKIDEAASTILYIGEESLTLTNLLMTHSSSQVSLVG